MSEVPSGLMYSREHEWLRPEDGAVRVGITAHAQDLLDAIVYVDFPEVGTSFVAGKTLAVVESVKATSDVFAPIDGTVLEVNALLDKTPELVNSDPYGDGWLVRLEISDPSQLAGLLDAEAYRALLAAEAE